MAVITSDRIVEGIKRRIVIPENQNLIDDEDILAICDDVTAVDLVPMLKSIRQDYFVTSTDIAQVASQNAYNIPERAAGMTIRDLKLKDSAGNVRDMDLIAIEDEHLFRQGGTSRGFYFKNDQIIMVPTPENADLTLEVWYEQVPSQYTLLENVSVVSTISSETVTTTAALPSTLSAGVEVDFVRAKPGGRLYSTDVAISSVSTPDIVFSASSDVPSDLAAGDYIAVAGTSPIFQLPNEMHPLLETKSCIRILEALGDFDGANALKGRESDEYKMILKLLEPRVTGESTKIINRRGLLNGKRGRFGRRGYIYGFLPFILSLNSWSASFSEMFL